MRDRDKAAVAAAGSLAITATAPQTRQKVEWASPATKPLRRRDPSEESASDGSAILDIVNTLAKSRGKDDEERSGEESGPSLDFWTKRPPARRPVVGKMSPLISRRSRDRAKRHKGGSPDAKVKAIAQINDILSSFASAETEEEAASVVATAEATIEQAKADGDLGEEDSQDLSQDLLEFLSQFDDNGGAPPEKVSTFTPSTHAMKRRSMTPCRPAIPTLPAFDAACLDDGNVPSQPTSSAPPTPPSGCLGDSAVRRQCSAEEIEEKRIKARMTRSHQLAQQRLKEARERRATGKKHGGGGGRAKRKA